MRYMLDPAALRSAVPTGSGLNDGWRVVGRWQHPEPVLILGGLEGCRFVYPRRADEISEEAKVAAAFDISLNAMTWGGRVALISSRANRLGGEPRER